MGGIDFSPMILFCCCMSSIWVSQKYYRQPETAAAGAVDGVMSAVTVNDDGRFYGSIFSRKPAVILLSVYMRRS